MYREEDYVPFLVGVFVFAGLIAFPLLWGLAAEMTYLRALPWGIGSAVVFMIGFTPDGEISWWRFVPAIIVIAVVGTVSNLSTGGPAFAAGGILGFVVVTICGYIGVGLFRLFRRS